MLEFEAGQLEKISRIFSRKYGADIGQQTVLEVLEMNRRTEIQNIMAVANTIARRLAAKAYNFYAETLPAGLMANSSELDARDPAGIIEAKEILSKLNLELVDYHIYGDRVPGNEKSAITSRRNRLRNYDREHYYECD